MRGVNLSVFDFDYDLTWAAFFLSPEEEVYGRYGGRDARSPDSLMSLAGLRHAMSAALAAHRRAAKTDLRPGQPSRTADQYPAAQRRPADSCIHCHHVYDFRRESLQAQGKWRLEELWVYPEPAKVGLTLDLDEGERVQAVARDSAADHAGLRAGDRLLSVNGVTVAALADVQFGLHRAGDSGEIPVAWLRAGKTMRGLLRVGPGWRKTDISWRWSLRGLEPSSWVHGEDLTASEKMKLGLPEQQLAFYEGNFVSAPARQAGIRQNDVILGVDGKRLEMTAQQFEAYIKLNYKVGDRLTYNILRAGQRVDVPMTLVGRPPF
jgi:serine protease Do